VAPLDIAQSFIAAATVSAIAGSRCDPVSIVFISDLKTGLGSRSFIADLLKTLEPNNSLAETFENDRGAAVGW
jgi:hypothetical protein